MRSTTNAVIAATVGAVGLSAVAMTDWVVGGISDAGSGVATSAAIHAVGYVLLLPVVVALRRHCASVLGRVGRVALTTLAVSLVAMILGFTGLSLVGETDLVGLLAGIGFLGMFTSALVLGVALWRSGAASKLSAILFVAPVPLLGILAALNALGVVESHPALMEASVYLGTAVLGHERLTTAQAVASRRPVQV
jgi:hypothetical protein